MEGHAPFFTYPFNHKYFVKTSYVPGSALGTGVHPMRHTDPCEPLQVVKTAHGRPGEQVPKSSAAQEVKHALECRCYLSRVTRKPFPEEAFQQRHERREGGCLARSTREGEDAFREKEERIPTPEDQVH